MSSSSNVEWHRLGSLGNNLGVGNGSIAEVVVVSWGSSIVVSSDWGSNGGSNLVVVSQSGSRGSGSVSNGGGRGNDGGGNSDGLLVDVGLSGDLDINVWLWGNFLMDILFSWDLLMDICLGSDILMDICLGSDILVDILFSWDLLVDVRDGVNLGIHIFLSGDILMDVGDGSRVEVSIGYGGVDSSVNSGHWGSSVGDGLGSHRGSVAISIRGSSIASWVASIPIASISGGDNSGGGRGQTGENSDKGFHF
jgi:hypothetical protein